MLDAYGRSVLISAHDLDAADRWFARHGHAAIFFSRLVPVVRTFISLPAGIARMPFGLFLLYTALGSLPWSLALVYVGMALGDHWESIRPIFQKFNYLVVAVIVVGIVWYVYRHVRHVALGPQSENELRGGDAEK